MMRNHGRKHARNGERGVTMIIVVIAMLSMLAMVALAIDVITLYAARSEAQRGADSAALAAAKMLVDMGVTADPSNGALQTTAQTAATKIATDVATQVAISGRQVQSTDVTVTYPNNAQPSFGVNPTVAVTVNRPNLPTFFSRIWSRAALSVSATATAEGFNPSNSAGITGTTGLPVISRCVKPFLLPNCDPNPSRAPTVPPPGCGGPAKATFFDPTTGQIPNPGQYPAGIIGETFNVTSSCPSPGPGCAAPNVPAAGSYYPALMPAAASGNACPATCGGGGTPFESDIECCNPSPIACGTTALPSVTYQLQLDNTVFPEGNNGPAQTGVECLVHQTPGNGQDDLNGGIGPVPPGTVTGVALNYPLQIQVGNNHPLGGTPSLSAGDYITTSDSLITVPVYDATGGVIPNASVNIIGFLQVFINRAFPGGNPQKAGSFDVTIVNVSGCGSGATGTPVFTGSPSAVPVRLIHQ
jgi:Flp pilus assembly protein TadG